MSALFRTLFLTLLLLAHTVAGARKGISDTPGHATGTDQYDYLIVDLVYNRNRSDSYVTALQDSEGRRFLPLRHLSLALGFRLQVDCSDQSAKGFLAFPRERLLFNGKTGTGICDGMRVSFQPGLSFCQDGDLYVEAENLGRLLQISFAWKPESLELEIGSKRPLHLPRTTFEDPEQVLPPQGYPAVAPARALTSPYQMASPPAMDVRVRSVSGTGREKGQDIQTASVEGHGDLLYMGARYLVSIDDRGKPRANLTLSRTDPDSRLLGSLHASNVEVGDLVVPPINLIQTGNSGLGVSISNAPPLYLNGLLCRDIEGLAVGGSTVELYRGGLLQASTKADGAGNYLFANVRCSEGPNAFLIVSIDPDGKILERSRTVYGSSSMLRPGQIRYNAFACRTGRTLFGSDYGSFTRNSNSEFGVELDRGLSNSSWASTIATQIGRNRYLGLGYNTWIGSTLGKFEAIASDHGTRSLSIGLSKNLGNAAISVAQESSIGAIGDLQGLGRDVTSDTQVRLEGFAGNRDPVSYAFSLDRYNGSNPSTQLRLRMNKSVGAISITNNLAVRLATNSPANFGLLQLRKSSGNSSARFELGYSWGNSQPYRSSRISFDQPFSSSFRVQYGLEHQAVEKRTALFGALYRTIGAIAIGGEITVSNSGVKVGLLFSTGIGPVGSASRFDFSSPHTASGGAIQARVYLDRNMSGKFDQGDELLPGVSLRVGGRSMASLTDKRGSCMVKGLPAGQEIAVCLDDDSLAEPSWVAGRQKVVVFPRLGKSIRVDIPVVATAELEGSIQRVNGDRKTWAGAEARLLDAAGMQIGSSMVDSNGGYVFSRIWPGTYSLQVMDADGSVLAQRVQAVSFGEVVKTADLVAGQVAGADVGTRSTMPPTTPQGRR